MVASIRSSTAGMGTGTNNQFTLTLPEGIQAGDLLVFTFMVGHSGATTNDHTTKGWWRYNAQSVNTRQWAFYARIYNPSDDAIVYTLTMDAQAAGAWVAHAIRDHGVVNSTDIQISANWRRGDNGGSQARVIAPSITTPSDDRLVLAITGEASNALGARRTVSTSGFELVAERTEGPNANQSIEWITAWQKTMLSAGATGDLELAWGTEAAPVVSLNGVGAQISIPSASIPEPELPEVGCIGSRVPTSVTHNSITMGVDRLQGGVVKVAAKLGATEVARQTVTIDTDSGWGSTTFNGLQPNAHYGFAFYVDDVLQTDTEALIQTHPTPGTPTSFKFIAGSCQFTGSNHPVWDRIREEGARQLGHMGDLHYGDATTLPAWRTAVESSFTAPRFRAMLGLLPMTWSWDNHDRIITNPTGAGTGLNLGETDPATNTEWRKLAGSAGWSSSDTAGRTWVIGRVRFIQTDQWTVRDDGDGDPAPRTFLGAAQKQWFKDTLDAANEPFVVWLCQWTGQNHANGRWNSFPEETTELENFINARPALKSRMVMIGGDSHSLQVTDGSRTLAQGQRFAGIPNYNISGFNRTSDSGQGGAGWLYDAPLRAVGQPEADWGGYSRMTFTDDGTSLTLLWEGVRVDKDGVTDIMASQTLVQEPDEIPTLHSGEGWVHADVVPVAVTGAPNYGDGEFEATVEATVDVSAPLSGSGGLSADTEAVVEVTAPFTGSGTLTAVLAVEQVAIIEATFTGTGSATADTSGVLSADVEAPFSGSGSLTASTSAELLATVSALFDGSGSLTVGLVTDQSAEIEAPLVGQGVLTAEVSAELIASVAANFTGQGQISISASTEQVIDAPFSGSGDASAVVSADDFAVVEAQFSGAGTLAAPVEIHIEISAPFASEGNMSMGLASLQDVLAEFTGSGALSAVAWAQTTEGTQVYLAGKLVVLSLGGETVTLSL